MIEAEPGVLAFEGGGRGHQPRNGKKLKKARRQMLSSQLSKRSSPANSFSIAQGNGFLDF